MLFSIRSLKDVKNNKTRSDNDIGHFFSVVSAVAGRDIQGKPCMFYALKRLACILVSLSCRSLDVISTNRCLSNLYVVLHEQC